MKVDAVPLSGNGIPVTITVNMPVVAPGNVVSVQHIQNIIVAAAAEHGGIVQKHHRLQPRLLRRADGNLQSLHLPCQYLGTLLLFVADIHPPPGAADAVLAVGVVVVVENVQGIQAVCLQEFRHFLHGVPPVVMVPLQQNLLPGQILYKLKIRQCLRQGHTPGGIPGQHHRILRRDQLPPVPLQQLHMVFPTAEHIHRLTFVQAQKMLNKMASKSDGKMKIKYVDLTSNPSFTSDYPNVDWQSSSANNIVLVESGKQYKVLTLTDCFEYDEKTYNYYGSYSFTGTKIEQAVVTAILNVTTDDKVVVDMIKGNNEQDYSSLKTLLENNAYQVNEVSLATGDFDSNAKIAIMYAPSVDLDEKIVEKLSTWLSNDGKYGRSLIYVPTADMGEMPNLDDFLKEWGMSIDRGYVFETDESTLVSASSPYAFTVSYGDYYKDNLKNSKIPVVVSESHAVNITDENTAHALLKTSDKAGVLPIDADKNWDYKDAVSGNGENVAAEGVMTNEDKNSSRVIIFGSYVMFSDTIMKYNSFNNSAYFMNVINTIADKEDVGITIESKSIDNTELGITDVATQNTMLVVFVIIIPIAILVAGFVFWLRRRNR